MSITSHIVLNMLAVCQGSQKGEGTHDINLIDNQMGAKIKKPQNP